MNSSAFDLDVTFTGNTDGDILTPFSVPDYRELRSATTGNSDGVGFEIDIRNSGVDTLVATIMAGSGLVRQEQLPAPLRAVGRHQWQWDGFGTNGVLDTRILKEPSLSLEFLATGGGVSKKKTLRFSNECAEQDWIDIRIDRTRKAVFVELRINVKDGGQSGAGGLPPRGVQAMPRYRGIPANDVRRQKHIRTRSLQALKGLLQLGLKRYWSRRIVVGGASYRVQVDPVFATRDAMDDIDVRYNTNGAWARSSNPGSVRGFYSLFGNLVPEQVVYNVGWIKYGNGWAYIMPAAADQEFSETAAHEIGHEILSAYGGDAYSYGHRGSSTVVTQEPRPLNAGGVSYPGSGEIDLMKYYHGPRPPGFFSRLSASEQDVKSLIWLARVRFNA
ncbi:hypothetical protein FKG94_23415 [Exilibacterium tricleocarpae]|uniref:Uncharacterized protein n=1 Tax=Exilibacterium tricleocarpae TaxID=2591008 RepID=A0A545STF8_9GAMM|nr:hypothetical protein [Exilibacterium tricleocarpae]TQV68250.1 hypothetical protein FKG94_23415 [Exilibacterium tricleocarpae]